jgi:predicted dehydrogenase
VSEKKFTSRRDFLKSATAAGTAIAGFPYIVPARALGKGGAVAPSNRIVMGAIGVGGQGTGNMMHFCSFPQVQMVAVCDVDREHSAAAKKAVEEHYAKHKPDGDWKGCESFGDFRELLARKDIDAVSICTPDHWHSVCSVAAANAGKDIYCEKPLSNSIAEGRAIVEAVRRNRRVLQTGSQERSGSNARYACELVRNGRLGRIHTVRINLPDDDDHHQQVRKMNHEPQRPMPVPENLDWNMWLGPAPQAEYNKNRCHFFWRFILAHGGGEMTDRGAHVIDIARLGLGDPAGPIEVQAKGKRDGEGFFDVFWDYSFEYQFPGGVRMIGKAEGPRGLRFEGENGWISIHIHGARLESSDPRLVSDEAVSKWAETAPDHVDIAASADRPPGEKVKPSEPGKVQLGKSSGHHDNFLKCVQQRRDPVAGCEIGHQSATACHLANIAMAVDAPFKWNPVKETSSNLDANKLIAHRMRKPWMI